MLKNSYFAALCHKHGYFPSQVGPIDCTIPLSQPRETSVKSRNMHFCMSTPSQNRISDHTAPPSKLNKIQYLLTGAKFEFAVKAKKFLISVQYLPVRFGGCLGGFIFRVKPPPTTNSRYLLRGTKFKFLVKTKKLPLTQTSTSNRLPSG